MTDEDVELLVEALQDVEWVQTPLYESECGLACPWCGGLNPTSHYWERHKKHRMMGHEENCLRRRALKAYK